MNASSTKNLLQLGGRGDGKRRDGEVSASMNRSGHGVGGETLTNTLVIVKRKES